MRKQLLCNFRAENSWDRKQLEAKVNDGVPYEKRVSGNVSEMGARTEKRQFGLGYGHKIQSRNPIKYFIMTKQIGYNRSSQILASLYLQKYISTWIFMVDYGRKWSRFSSKGICEPKAKN